MPKVEPEVLIWARETAGLTPEEAARKLSFRETNKRTAEGRLADLEAGEEEPSRSVLAKMAQQYRRPLVTFYLSKPPARGDRGVDFRSSSTQHSAPDEALLDALVRDTRACQSMVRALLDEEDEAEPLTFIGSHRIEDGQPRVLVYLQRLLNLDLTTFRAQSNALDAFNLLRERVERAGVFVLIKGDLGNHVTAFRLSIFRGYSISDPVAPFIVINNRDAKSAWSFSLLHEMVHLLLGQTGFGNARAENEVERFCDDVASDFLLRPQELGSLAINNSMTLAEASERISEFSKQSKLSHTMVAYRAYRAGHISQETYDKLDTLYRTQWREARERERARARERGGGPDPYTVRRHRLGKRLTEFVQRMMVSDALSTAKAARLLGVKAQNIQRLLAAG